MTEEEAEVFFKSEEEVAKDSSIMRSTEEAQLLRRMDMNLGHLRYIEDRHYDVDLEYEKTRDLYEKQRVVDSFLSVYEEENKLMNKYYENTYKQSELNKFDYAVYENIYEPGELRFNFLLSTFSTLILAGSLAVIHPAFALLTVYDFFLLTKYSLILNSTVYHMTLRENKRQVTIGTLNFLGFLIKFDLAEKRERISLKDIKYIGKFENTFLNLEITGLPPSFSRFRMKKEIKQKLEKEKVEKQTGKKEESEEKLDLKGFRHFERFIAKNKIFMVPIDHPEIDKVMPSRDLLDLVIKGR